MTNFKVLLVDDEEEFLWALTERLKNRDLQVDGVTTGEDALSFIDRDPVDVVVLDVRLPGMDGVETLNEIKKRNPLIEVLILTGYANTETCVKVMELGAFDYLVKPVDIDELMYKLQDAHRKKSLKEQQQT